MKQTEWNEVRVLKRIGETLRAEYRYKGETTGHVGGHLWKFSGFLFYLFAIYTFLLDGVHVLTLALALDNNYQKQLSGNTTDIATPEKYAASMGYFRQTLILMSFITLTVVAVWVLVRCRKHLAAFITSAVTTLLSFAVYAQMTDSTYLYIRNFKGIFFLLYGTTLWVPLALLWRAFIWWRDHKRVKAEYQRLTEKLYRRNTEAGHIITASEWESLLEEEAAQSGEAPPLPQRRHRRAYEVEEE